MNLRRLLPVCLLALGISSLRAEDVVLLQFEKEGALLPPVVVELFESDAPKHAANFKKLATSGFYKNTAVHRALPGALLQMGDPLSRRKDSPDVGTGGPGYTLPAEIKQKHAAGTVAMGRLPDRVNPGRLSNGSQFYVALKPLPELDGTDTVFGRVTRGLESLDELSRLTTDTNDAPTARLLVNRTKVVPREKLESEVAAWSKTAGKKTAGWFSRNVKGLIPGL